MLNNLVSPREEIVETLFGEDKIVYIVAYEAKEEFVDTIVSILAVKRYLHHKKVPSPRSENLNEDGEDY